MCANREAEGWGEANRPGEGSVVPSWPPLGGLLADCRDSAGHSRMQQAGPGVLPRKPDGSGEGSRA